MTVELGKVEEVDLRTAWNSEAGDFTPWLASKGLDTLCETLGLTLELSSVEQRTGAFRADIVAETEDGEKVVIENQLEKTDHDHLGKCLTYAAVIGAKTIIWIAGEFCEEHQKALEWINDNSVDDIAVYGVQVKLMKIGNSLPAPVFDVVCKPNNVVRRSRQPLGGTKEFQLLFWEDFCNAMKNANYPHSLQKADARPYYTVRVGSRLAHIANRCSLIKNKVSVNIYIPRLNAIPTLAFLEGKKAVIESALGAAMDWEQGDSGQDKVIHLERSDFDLHDNGGKIAAINWMVEKTIALRKCLNELLTSDEAPVYTSDDDSEIEE